MIRFIHQLPITIGEDAGKRFVLRPWQERFIRDVYEPVGPNSRRIVRRAVLSIARKNGKTELAAALILVHLVGPEAELNGEIYSAANDREQAAIVFNAVVRMVEATPALSAVLTVVKSTKTIFVRRSDLRSAGSKFRALSADAGTKHGLNPSMVIYDELAQAKSRELLDTLTTSQGARAEPLFLTISTQSHDPQHPLSEMIDDGLKAADPSTVCHLYAAPDGCDVLDEEAWAAANPALGDFRSLDELRTMAQRASRLPSEEQSFRLLYLNQRVAAVASLISRADWQSTGDPDRARIEPGEAIYLALDLSGRFDLTALTALSVENGSRVQAWFWKPEELVADHSKRDGFAYDLAVRNDQLLTTPGRAIDPMAVALKIAELCQTFDVRGLAYDRWRIDELLRCLDQIGLQAQKGEGDGLRIVDWGQGFGDMSPAVDAFEESVVQAEIAHPDNAVLNFCVMNAVAVMDASGNRKLSKEKSRFRIDGAVALAMALGLKARDRRDAAAEPTPFEDPNFNYFFG